MYIKITFNNNKVKEFTYLSDLRKLDKNQISKIESDIKFLENLPLPYSWNKIIDSKLEILESLNRITKGKANLRTISSIFYSYKGDSYYYLSKDKSLPNREYVDMDKVKKSIHDSKLPSHIIYDRISDMYWDKTIIDLTLTNTPIIGDVYLYEDNPYIYVGKWNNKFILSHEDKLRELDSLDGLDLINYKYNDDVNIVWIGDYYISRSKKILIKILGQSGSKVKVTVLDPIGSPDPIEIDNTVLNVFIKLLD